MKELNYREYFLGRYKLKLQSYSRKRVGLAHIRSEHSAKTTSQSEHRNQVFNCFLKQHNQEVKRAAVWTPPIILFDKHVEGVKWSA